LTYFKKNKLTNLLNIFITISDNGNMLKPQLPLFSIGNSLSPFQFGKSMKINKVKTDSVLLNSTSNASNMTTGTKALPYTDTP